MWPYVTAWEATKTSWEWDDYVYVYMFKRRMLLWGDIENNTYQKSIWQWVKMYNYIKTKIFGFSNWYCKFEVEVLIISERLHG